MVRKLMFKRKPEKNLATKGHEKSTKEERRKISRE
jgi:hypothetical protein